MHTLTTSEHMSEYTSCQQANICVCAVVGKLYPLAMHTEVNRIQWRISNTRVTEVESRVSEVLVVVLL